MLRQSLTSYHTAVNRNSVKPKDPSTVFELENFLSLLGDTLKASEDIAHQSHEILQTFIWLRGGEEREVRTWTNLRFFMEIFPAVFTDLR